ncbi:Biopolymer transport protein ExbD/TolR [Planctomycetes bacterium Pla163]|uniref:Biopolymer transport protein ExbD/TolR n=1 Tax=Rohdeia mirabilis TaxID=2528008 RepID=A0A518D2G3_9BACT|nr:Biopolymer transport protein ExbD/TolR [Planctomycetes bacterium Pla163]
MASRRKKQMKELTESKADMEMTPMIDVTFLLLIFFMCTIKFKKLEGKLAAYLPKDIGQNTTQVDPVEKLDIRLDVVVEGEKRAPDGIAAYKPGVHPRFNYVDRVFSIKIGPREFTSDQIEEVADRLRVFASDDPERPVTIDPRRGIVMEDVVRVLDRVLDAGFTKVSFAGSYEG